MDDALIWDHFQETVPLSYQHVVVFMSDFVNDTIQVPEKNMTISLWSMDHEHYRLRGKLLPTALKLLEAYETRFKTKYPSEKLDIVSLRKQNYLQEFAFGILFIEYIKDTSCFNFFKQVT